MLDADRFKLLFGPYPMPRCRVGLWLRCAASGMLKVVAISDAPIMWPLCNSGKHLVPIVCGEQVKAIKRESNQGAAHHWAVSDWTETGLHADHGFVPAS